MSNKRAASLMTCRSGIARAEASDFNPSSASGAILTIGYRLDFSPASPAGLRPAGRGGLDIDSRYLLSGFARCETGGGGFAGHTRSHGGKRALFYGCTSFWKRGKNICGNNLVGRVEVIEAEVIATLQDDVCRPAVIEEAIRRALEELAPAGQDRNRERLAAELATVRHECDRLAEAIGQGGPLDALVQRLAERQAHHEAIARAVSQSAAERPHVDLSTLETRYDASWPTGADYFSATFKRPGRCFGRC